MTRFLLFIALLSGTVYADQPLEKVLCEGDIIFQETRSEQSTVIALATGSRFSHTGIVLRRNGRLVVYEAVGPVRVASIRDFIRQGIGGRYVVRRLKSGAPDREAAARLKAYCDLQLGKPYDFGFMWSDEKMYCSELVWKAYRSGMGLTVGEPQNLGSLKLNDRRVQSLMRKRYGDDIPYHEPMISPGRLFDSPLLETVGYK
jgi:uncharacterized protein YycO